jgi:carbamoyl-phosphate synthase large subunit
MGRRLLVTGAGTGASNNLIRSLRAGDPTFWIVGVNHDRFVLKKSIADQRYLLPAAESEDFPAALMALVERERIALVIPTTDREVSALADLRDALGPRCFLPDRAAIARCQDKHALTAHLAAHAIPIADTRAVTGLDALPDIFARLGGAPPFWCRARTGSRSLGAAPMRSPEQARAWMLYWQEMRGVPVTSFIVSEYLPGRDFLCQSLWKDGVLILANTFERLSYFGGESNPSGVSSLSSLAKTVVDARVLETSRAAVRSLGPSVSGVFSVDLKENRRGVPCVTEINAGRFFIGMTAFDHVGKHNLPLTFARLALGEPVTLRDEYDATDDYYLVRDLDTLPGVFHADELFEGIEMLPAPPERGHPGGTDA